MMLLGSKNTTHDDLKSNKNSADQAHIVSGYFRGHLTAIGAVNIAIWKFTSFDVNLPMKKQRDF